MNFLKTLWSKVPVGVQHEAHSFLQTFISVFLLAVGTNLQTGGFPVGKSALFALVISSFRVSVKASYNSIMFPAPPQS